MKYSDVIDDNCGIYAIKNKANEKLYIGQSHNIKYRWQMHKAALRNDRAANTHLQNAWNKYGEDNFEFFIIELCDKKLLDEREVFWIGHYDSVAKGYNLQFGGNASRGWKMSEDGKKKLSLALTGRKFSLEHCKNISAAQKEYYKTHIPVTSRPVVCLNTREEFINATQANMKYPSADISALHECCKGNHLSCGKDEQDNCLVWVYKEDYYKLSENEIANRLKNVSRAVAAKKLFKPVKCITTGEIFDSLNSASEHYHISKSNLNGCLKGRQKTAGKHLITKEPLYWAYCG